MGFTVSPKVVMFALVTFLLLRKETIAKTTYKRNYLTRDLFTVLRMSPCPSWQAAWQQADSPHSVMDAKSLILKTSTLGIEKKRNTMYFRTTKHMLNGIPPPIIFSKSYTKGC